MPPFIRQLVPAFVLLLVFLAAALTGQAWLQREARRLQSDAIAAKRAEFPKVFELTHRLPAAGDEDFQRALGELMGGTVVFYGNTAPPPLETLAPGMLGFDYRFPGERNLNARVTFANPAASRLVVLHERMFVAVILLALLLVLVLVLLALPRRASAESGTRPSWDATRAEMRGMEHFARISVERSDALARESGARHRAEEDLQLNRTLLGQSLEERVLLGRDLHDNISQTLYAVSLTLEGLRAKLAAGKPEEAAQRLDQCITELRRLNREVRVYIKDLEPGTVQRQPFMEALDVMLSSQSHGENTRLVCNLDAEATALIAPERAADAVNVLREAISNSLRHARAGIITVHAHRGDNTVMLAVQDDGAGFEPAAVGGRGHGLANMQARASALGGTLDVVSTPGKGTRVLLTLPVTSAPS